MANKDMQVYEVLRDVVSQDPARVTAATTRLQELENEAGTYNIVQAIATEKTVPIDMRKAAIIRLKNTVVGHWRRRALFSDESRLAFRTRSLSFLTEEDDTIANFNAIIVAKLARVDYPGQWPTLITDLMSVIAEEMSCYRQNSHEPWNGLRLKRALGMLNQIIKEIASIKMPAGTKVMTALSSQLSSPMSQCYAQFSAVFVQPLDLNVAQTPYFVRIAEISHLAYKCLAKLMLWLYSKLGQSGLASAEPLVATFFQSSHSQLQTVNSRRTEIAATLFASNSSRNAGLVTCLSLLTRHVRVFGKVFRRMIEYSATRFVGLPGSIDAVLYYWNKLVEASAADARYIGDSDESVYPIRFLVQGLVLMKDTLPQWSPARKNNTQENTLSQAFVENAVEILITRFIPLASTDLEKWTLDGEDWANMEENEPPSWEFELRPCAERVLMTLSNRYSSFVTPYLYTAFNRTLELRSESLPTILQKEALYCALGRCATNLKEVIDFKTWLATNLANEVRSTNPDFRILKRRIAWLVARWITTHATTDDPIVWDVLLHLLSDHSPSSDAVVRLTAASALRDCVDTMHFDADMFQPFLASAVTELLQLGHEAETQDSKRRVSAALRIIVEMVDTRIVPHMQVIANAIPMFCQLDISLGASRSSFVGNGDHEDFTFKAELMVLTATLCKAAKQDSVALNPIVVPLIREGLTPPVSLGLDSDALSLWIAVLRNATTVNSALPGLPALMDLFPLAVQLLGENLDLLGDIISIVKSYALLAPDQILQAYGTPLFTAIMKVLKTAVPENGKDAIIALSLIVRATQVSAHWATALHASSLFAELLHTLIKDKLSATILTEYIYAFARMLMKDANTFVQLMCAAAVQLNQTESWCFEELLNQWWRKFDNMPDSKGRKLAAMGIAALVSTGRPEALGRLATETFNIWVDVFGEIREALRPPDDGEEESPLKLFWKNRGDDTEEVPDDAKRSLEEQRWIQLSRQDPVMQVKLTAYVGAQLSTAENLVGEQMFRAKYLATADAEVIEQVQRALGDGL